MRIVALTAGVLFAACVAFTDEPDEVLVRGADAQGNNLRSPTWPDNVRITAWMPVIDTVCDKWLQIYVTLEAIDCDPTAAGPKLDSWEIGVRPVGSNQEKYRLVLDPLKLDVNTECRLHYASRPWQSPHAFAMAEQYELSLQGPLGLSSLRFSSFKPSNDLNVVYHTNDSNGVEVNVEGLAIVPASGAFVDHVVSRSIHGKLQVRAGLMQKWFDLSHSPNGAMDIDHFSAQGINDALPQGVQLRMSYAIRTIDTDAIETPDGESEQVPRVAINVIRYVDRPFDVSRVDCSI
jgi:hypothetical protein